MNFKRVLAIGAHTDDVELGCGGTLNRLKRQGATVAVVALSRAEASVPEGMPADTMEREFHASMAVLGADEAFVHRHPVRRFPEYRQEILDDLIQIGRTFDPDLVLTMNGSDTHQDHQVTHAESVRAFRHRNLWAYESPWNQRVSVTNCFIELEREDVEAKGRMLAEYHSQALLNRGYTQSDYVHSSAFFRGQQAKMPLAEAFEIVNLSWRLGLSS